MKNWAFVVRGGICHITRGERRCNGWEYYSRRTKGVVPVLVGTTDDQVEKERATPNKTSERNLSSPRANSGDDRNVNLGVYNWRDKLDFSSVKPRPQSSDHSMWCPFSGLSKEGASVVIHGKSCSRTRPPISKPLSLESTSSVPK